MRFQKIGFFLLAFALGFFLISAVVYCEQDYNKINPVYELNMEEYEYPSWLIGLSSIS